MSKCCSVARKDLVVAASGEKTCSVSATALIIFNKYILNKQQVLASNNTINYSDTKVKNALGKDAVSKKALFISF